MSSPAQVTANIANAQQSTGPRTDPGKAASAQNSLKHGLTAKTILLPGEDEAAYRKMCEGMIATFAPASTPEQELVQLLCDTQWRLQRCGRIEAAILSADTLDFKALDIMSKHESRLKKQYSVTLKEAQGIIETRQTREAADMKDAMAIRRTDKLANCVTNLHEIGFVFSDQQIEAAIRREDEITVSHKALARQRVAEVMSRGSRTNNQK